MNHHDKFIKSCRKALSALAHAAEWQEIYKQDYDDFARSVGEYCSLPSEARRAAPTEPAVDREGECGQIFRWLERASQCGIEAIQSAATIMKGYYQGIGPEPEYDEQAAPAAPAVPASLMSIPYAYEESNGDTSDLVYAEWFTSGRGQMHPDKTYTPLYTSPPSPSVDQAKRLVGGEVAGRDVLAERRRQIEQEGWSAARDDRYTDCELARAASTYALCTSPEQLRLCGLPTWPWGLHWWKPADYRRNLVKAGALIIAEIERIDRASTGSATSTDTKESA